MTSVPAEVDFHDLWVILAGLKTKTMLFTMRLSFSARAARRASGHRRAAGVPGRPRVRLQPFRRCADRQDPLRRDLLIV